MTPISSAKISALVVDHSKVAVAVEAERDVLACSVTAADIASSISISSGFRIVMREGEIEIANEGNDLDAQCAQKLGREGAARSLPQAATTLSRRLNFGRAVRSAMRKRSGNSATNS